LELLIGQNIIYPVENGYNVRIPTTYELQSNVSYHTEIDHDHFLSFYQKICKKYYPSSKPKKL